MPPILYVRIKRLSCPWAGRGVNTRDCHRGAAGVEFDHSNIIHYQAQEAQALRNG